MDLTDFYRAFHPEITPSILSEHNTIKLGLNKKRSSRKLRQLEAEQHVSQ
jgi:hypothetical protein